MKEAEYYISKLNLESHIEGGYFRETYRNGLTLTDGTFPYHFDGERSLATTIYYLLKSGQVSRFHCLKFDEIWFYHTGSPMVIHMFNQKGTYECVHLGLDLEKGQTPQILICAGVIFGAEPLEGESFSLVSCLVSPGFDFRDFQMYESGELVTLFPDYKELIDRIQGAG